MFHSDHRFNISGISDARTTITVRDYKKLEIAEFKISNIIYKEILTQNSGDFQNCST